MEQQQEATWHALAGLLAYAGHDVLPTQSDEDRSVYRVVGAGLMWEMMQTMKALTGFVGGMKK